MAILDVIKSEMDAHALVWKHPAEDFNTHSTLIVDASQMAVFYKNGQVADVFTAGRYVLSTQNIPILRKLLELPTGGVSTFSCKVYFVNITEAMNLKWGLSSKVSYIEPVYQIPVSIGARGRMSIRVADPARFIVNLVGSEHGLTAEELTEYFRSLMVMRVKSYLTKTIIENNMSIFTIDGELEALAEALKARIAPDMEEYGFRLLMFTVDDIIKPEDDPLYIRVKRALSERSTGLFEAQTSKEKARIAAQASAEVEAIGAQGHKAALDTLGTSYQQERQLDIAQAMAANEGTGGFPGLAGGMAMMPGAIAVGSMAANAMNFAAGPMPGFNAPGSGGSPAQGQTEAARPQPDAGQSVSAASSVPASRKCKNCGTEIPVGYGFCFKCGTPQPPVCPSCGRELPEGCLFCPFCGTKI